MTDRYSACAGVVACDLDNGRAILNLETSEYFRLNATAAIVWQCLEGGSTVTQIVQRVCDEFDVLVAECRDDIVTLLKELDKAGLIEKAS